jgi:DNA topoisomerase-2
MIKIRNYGVVIPIQIHPKEKVYGPEMIFGLLLTSSNYDTSKKRYTCGRNGYGAKLVNIFSTRFRVTVKDGRVHKKTYVQEWKNNMKDRGEPKITEGYKGVSYVEIEYETDFKRFGYEAYTTEMLQVFSRNMVDLSYTWKIPIRINSTDYDFSDVEVYAKTFFPEVEEYVVHRQYNKNRKLLPEVELCILSTIDEGEIVPFVNGMFNRGGGVHVDAAYQALQPIVDMINSSTDSTVKIKWQDLKKHLTVIVNCQLPDPTFGGQTKTILESPKVSIRLAQDIIQQISQWGVIERLTDELTVREKAKMTKGDGKRGKRVKISKGTDANWAGTDKSSECTLIVCEGKSAAGFAITMISSMEDGFNRYGLYPARGKSLNTRQASRKRILENKEATEIRRLVGAVEGIDYTEPANRNTLRYASLCILTDSDYDGYHCRGLVIGMIEHRFPSLVPIDFILHMRTPTVVVSAPGNKRFKFYTQDEYEDWMKVTKDSGSSKYKHMYYKGLGSNTKKDTLEIASEPRMVVNTWDEEAHESLEMCFGRGNSNQRKEWLTKIDKAHLVSKADGTTEEQSITEFVYNEFIYYSVENVKRSIPAFEDSLKPSIRKIIWAALKHWSTDNNPSKGLKKNMQTFKVAQFAAFVAQSTNYHHGEVSLEAAIVGLAQNFVGSNNLEVLEPHGEFGHRYYGGKDRAASRYIFTVLNEMARYLFNKDDIALIPQQEEEGHKIEPEFLLTLLPIVLLNGTSGVATGYSTFIPPYNPLKIASWVQARIKGEGNVQLKPWYRNFKGKINVEDVKAGDDEETGEPVEGEEKEAKDDSDDEIVADDDGDVQFCDATTSKRMTTQGIWKVEGNKIIVSELPIQRWDDTYYQYLQNLVQKKVIKSFEIESSDMYPLFRIVPNGEINEKDLRLKKKFGLSNMVFVKDKVAKPFESVYEYLEAWYRWRLPWYEMRRQNLINSFSEELHIASERIRFIEAVNEDTIIIRKRKKDDIKADMIKMKFDPSIFTGMHLDSLTDDKIKELQKDIERLQELINKYTSTSDKEMWLEDLEEFVKAYTNWKRRTDLETAKLNKIKKNGMKGTKRASKKGKEKMTN